MTENELLEKNDEATNTLEQNDLVRPGSNDTTIIAEDGLAKLVLTLVYVLIEVIERQAYRRVYSGTLREDEIERLGNALIATRKTFLDLCHRFGIEPKELDIAIGKILRPINRDDVDNVDNRQRTYQSEIGSASIIELIDRIIEKETTISGQIKLSMAGIDLVVLNLLAMLQPVEGRRS
jgi:Gas vesicle protein K/Gas vesicle protein